MNQALSLGDFFVWGLSEGCFFLDGGAMFGVVPKVLWEKKAPADPRNRIKLGLNSLLVKTPQALVLVETGIGTKGGERLSDFYNPRLEPGLLPSIAAAGYRPEDIDYVVNTHLHFDHCGGNTSFGESGSLSPTFPRARYVLQQKEWEDALNPTDRDRASYLQQNFAPLKSAGRVRFVDGDAGIVPGVDVVVTAGHTRAHQSVRVRSRGQTLFYLGDLVPTTAHVPLAYVMSYDLFPVETLKTKKRIYERAIREDWIMAFVHDPVHYFGKVVAAGRKYEFLSLSDSF